MNKPFDFYKEVLDEVPAYNAYMAKYLQENPSLTISEFSDIPLLTKKDYLLEYPIEDLCKRGDFANAIHAACIAIPAVLNDRDIQIDHIPLF